LEKLRIPGHQRPRTRTRREEKKVGCKDSHRVFKELIKKQHAFYMEFKDEYAHWSRQLTILKLITTLMTLPDPPLS
jgi:hypothetical protein